MNLIESAPGLAAVLLGLTVLIAAHALLSPRDTTNLRKPPPRATDAERSSEGEQSFNKYVRPMLGEFVPAIGSAARLTPTKRDAIQQLITRAGNPWHITPEEYRGSQILLGALGAALGTVMAILGVDLAPWFIMVGAPATMGALIPFSVHNTAREKRSAEIRKQLPEALDLLVVTMSSGLNFEPALAQVTPRLPRGLLKDELSKVSAEIQAGRSLESALMAFSNRAASDEAEGMAKAVAQAQALGADVSETLSAQAVAARDAFEALLEKKIASLSTRMFMILAPTVLPAFLIIFVAPAASQLQLGLN